MREACQPESTFLAVAALNTIHVRGNLVSIGVEGIAMEGMVVVKKGCPLPASRASLEVVVAAE